jgi:hypothetical protein
MSTELYNINQIKHRIPKEESGNNIARVTMEPYGMLDLVNPVYYKDFFRKIFAVSDLKFINFNNMIVYKNLKFNF